MIYNVRGTSGSGKSTLVRELMKQYPHKTRVKEEGRRQPIAYILRNDVRQPLAIIGHYETACGGCDTIPKMEKIFQMVRKAHDDGFTVIFEGLLISADIKRTLQLHKDGYPLKVVALSTPIELCVESINERRWAKNPDKPPVNPRNTVAKHKGVQSSMRQLQEAGVDAVWASREEALELMTRELG